MMGGGLNVLNFTVLDCAACIYDYRVIYSELAGELLEAVRQFADYFAVDSPYEDDAAGGQADNLSGFDKGLAVDGRGGGEDLANEVGHVLLLSFRSVATLNPNGV